MTFSPLEALLMSAVLSAFIGFIVRLKSVSHSDCTERRKNDLEYRERQERLIEEIKKSNDIQFRMLRVIVAHLDIPAKDKAELLNMGTTG